MLHINLLIYIIHLFIFRDIAFTYIKLCRGTSCLSIEQFLKLFLYCFQYVFMADSTVFLFALQHAVISFFISAEARFNANTRISATSSKISSGRLFDWTISSTFHHPWYISFGCHDHRRAVDWRIQSCSSRIYVFPCRSCYVWFKCY